MSIKGAIRTALWTEIREALIKDFPDTEIPQKAPAALKEVIISNADYITELATGS